MIHRVRKCRVLGSAASTWPTSHADASTLTSSAESVLDIAPDGFWSRCGSLVDLRPRKDMKDKYSIVASNGVIDLKL